MMKLHEDKKLFHQAVQIASEQMNIPAIFVEKDYWISFVLHTIFHNKIGEETVFKGGTALSKCFGAIERFSEDIDLVVFKRKGESNNQLTKKIKQISEVVNSVLPEVEIANLTQKKGMNRKTAHTYAKEFNGDYGQIRDVIIVEATWLGCSEPYTIKKVSSLIYEMMIKTGQAPLVEEYNLQPFEVKVLDLTRTVCEKIMSLVKFSYGKEPVEDLKMKIRHTYDLHQLLKEKELANFFDSPEFDAMMLKVANDDVISYRNNNSWLVFHPNKAKIFAELETIWEELKTAYNSDFRKLVFGNFPNESEVLTTMKRIKERLKTIEWSITIENT